MSNTRPTQDRQYDTFTGLEPQHPWLAFLEPSVPDAASVFSASPRMLSETLWSHECLSAGSAPLSFLDLAPTASPTQTAGAREQPVSLMDWDLWVEPPVAPDDAFVLPDDAPEAPHASVSHNINQSLHSTKLDAR